MTTPILEDTAHANRSARDDLRRVFYSLRRHDVDAWSELVKENAPKSLDHVNALYEAAAPLFRDVNIVHSLPIVFSALDESDLGVLLAVRKACDRLAMTVSILKMWGDYHCGKILKEWPELTAEASS